MKIPIPYMYCKLMETSDKNPNTDMHQANKGSDSPFAGGQTTYQTGKTPMPAHTDPSYYP